MGLDDMIGTSDCCWCGITTDLEDMESGLCSKCNDELSDLASWNEDDYPDRMEF